MLQRCLISVLLVLSALFAQAQKRVSVDAEIKSLADGKVTTVTRRIHCQRDGRLVTVTFTPVKSYLVQNLKGEARFYAPSSNEVYSVMDSKLSSQNNLLYIFLSGHTDDLGLIALGYNLKTSQIDNEGYLKRTYISAREDLYPSVELVLKNYLPIYVEYKDTAGNPLGKTYLSDYDTNSSFVFPKRVTEISYIREKHDSTITRTIYSVPDLSGKDKDFDFQIPQGAKPVASPLAKFKEAIGK